jgi:hypothetical protein
VIDLQLCPRLSAQGDNSHVVIAKEFSGPLEGHKEGACARRNHGNEEDEAEQRAAGHIGQAPTALGAAPILCKIQQTVSSEQVHQIDPVILHAQELRSGHRSVDVTRYTCNIAAEQRHMFSQRFLFWETDGTDLNQHHPSFWI